MVQVSSLVPRNFCMPWVLPKMNTFLKKREIKMPVKQKAALSHRQVRKPQAMRLPEPQQLCCPQDPSVQGSTLVGTWGAGLKGGRSRGSWCPIPTFPGPPLPRPCPSAFRSFVDWLVRGPDFLFPAGCPALEGVVAFQPLLHTHPHCSLRPVPEKGCFDGLGIQAVRWGRICPWERS